MDELFDKKEQPVFEFKLQEDEGEVDLSKLQFDVKTLDSKIGFNSDDLIERQAVRAEKSRDKILNDVLSDTKWYGDSFEMSAIKEEIRNLQAIHNLKDKAEPEALLNQYDRMIAQTKEYLAAKDGKISFYAARHEKVRDLLQYLENEREALTLQLPKLEALADTRSHRDVRIELLHDKDCQDDAYTLIRALTTAVPAEEQEFLAKHESIMNSYRKLIKRVKGISNSFCIFSAAKKRRQDAKRQLARLEKDFEKFSALTFESMRPDQRFCTWEDEYNYPVVELDDNFFKQHQNLQYSEAMKEDGYRVLSNMLDAREMFVVGDRKVKSFDEEYYALPEAKGITIDEAFAKAEELGLPLMYSDKATEQLENIQIIDFIMGQTNRNNASFEVKCQVKDVENVDYLVITDVKVRNHASSLGTESPEEMNKEESNAHTNKKQLYVEMDQLDDEQKKKLSDEMERKFADTGAQILITGYSYKLADKIIDLDEKRLFGYFKSLGMEDAVIEAVEKRLKKVKEILKEDRDEGFRHRREEQAAQDDMKSQEMKDYMRLKKREKLVRNSKFTYIHGALIQDAGSRDMADVKEINKKDTEIVKSKGALYKKFKLLTDSLAADKEKIAGEVTKDETLAVLKAIENYTSCDYDWEHLKSQDIHHQSWKTLMERFEPERVKTFEGKDKEEAKKLFFEQEGNVAQYFERMRSLRRKNAVAAIKQRIDLLDKKQQKDAYDTEELTKLNTYLQMLDHNTTGVLVVPEKQKVKIVKDAQFTKDYQFKDARDIELFPEEPALSDVIQGNVGNCYLIATLGAVTEAMPSYIKKSMKDNGDGTVTVRLFMKNKMDDDYYPVYVTVDKTIAYDKKNKMVGSKGALWVKIFEKAIAAAGIKKEKFSAYSIHQLASGSARIAFGWITGVQGADMFSKDPREMNLDIDEEMPPDWKYKDKKTNKTGYTEKFLQRVAKVKKSLQTLTKNDAVIVAGAFQKLAGAPGVGLNGEGVRRGIAGMHAYTVLKLEEINGETYVRIRNPWGVGVVETVQNDLTGKTVIKEANRDEYSGSFLIHINTFVEHFDTVHYLYKADNEDTSQNEE